jgi:hypothetical protein
MATPYSYAMSPPTVSQPTGLGLTFGGVPYGANQTPISSPPQTAQPPIFFANGLLPQQPLHAPRHLPPRPLSAGPITSASQLPQSMIPGFPAPDSSNGALLPFPLLQSADMAHTVEPIHQYHTPPPAQPHQQLSFTPSPLATEGQEPEEGKGERALRVTRHLRLSSRHRSVSPTSHRYPSSQPLEPAVQDEEQRLNRHNLGVPAPHPRTRMLPFPPTVTSPASPGMAMLPLIASSAELPAQEQSHQPTTAVLHSPRPHLTPKHSLTNITDAYNKTTRIIKSECVEELEKMADVVVQRSGNDLSGDVPKVVVAKMEEELREQEKEARDGVNTSAEKVVSLKRNKTLPGPPPPPPTLNGIVHETEPLPSDQTPPTPTLHALAMRSRGRDKEKEKREFLQELRTENGLDALERRLLREVGTRKTNAPPRPDVRDVLLHMPLEPVKESDLGPVTRDVDRRKSIESGDRSMPIPIPVKSPEPLNNDSAISSLTLAGRMEEMDDDQDSDGGKTHRAWSRSSLEIDNGRGKSRESMGVFLDDDWSGLVLHRHTRERAEIVTNGRTPTKTPEADDRDKVQTSPKEKPGAQRKKAKAKGRVAAWLGEIDVGAPPQEQIIPPSPSVVRGPDEISGFLDATGSDDDENREEKGREAKEGTAAPNPRSSGFVPIGSTVNATTALNRNTIHFNLGLGPSSMPLVTLRDATVVEEARRVQALWDGGGADLSSLDSPPPQGKTREEEAKTPKQAEVVPAMIPTPGNLQKFPLSFPPLVRAQSIRTDRRVSPPSNAIGNGQKKPLGMQTHSRPGQVPIAPPNPMSYSAAAKNAWKSHNSGSASGVAPSNKITLPSLSAKPTAEAERLSPFPFPSHSKPTLDPEVRYDIRSARGGRGGKVAAVANLWATGAVMNQGASNASSSSPTAKVRVLRGLENVGKIDRDRGKEMATRAVEERQRRNGDILGNLTSKPLVTTPGTDTKPITFGVPTRTERKTFSAALMSPAPPPPPPASTKPHAKKPPLAFKPSPSKHFAEDQKLPDARKAISKPTSRAPANISANRPTPTVATSRPSGSQSPQFPQGGRTTPMPILRSSLSTPSSPDRSKADMNAYPNAGPAPKTTGVGGLKHKPGMIMPPSTNPAAVVLSSSHAVPHLSSTASLARPHAPRKVPAVTIVSPGSVAPRMFPTMLSTSKSAPSLIATGSDTLPSPPLRVGSPGKPPDLSFGQARLRDLIKKYQGQGS